MFIIGITGGTGSGKTTALRALESLGVMALDADAIYHELLTDNTELKSEIEAQWGGVSTGGAIDRKKLGEIVFSDPDALLKLNSITHKYVGEEIQRRLARWEAQGGTVAAIDAIALIESGRAGKCDVVVGVSAPAGIRIKRIMDRDGITRKQAETRVAAQKPAEFYEENCDHMLEGICDTSAAFKQECRVFFSKLIKGEKNMPEKDELFYKKKDIHDTICEGEIKLADVFCDDYKKFLDAAKTERESVTEAIRIAESRGFAPLERGMELEPGAKIYRDIGGKALMLAVIGRKPLSDGANFAAAHVDAPRLDLKQVPLYEDGELAFFKTHYYGGVKKYQWTAQPLSIHGVVIKKDGEAVEIVIGEDEADPVFMITDLLPHLGKDQAKKTLGEAFTGEDMNILVGSKPMGDDKEKDRVKLTVMTFLNEKYGITEEDLMSAELSAVPLMRARDVGFDRSMIGAYAHDDRSSAFAALKAILEVESPPMTAVSILIDKEEIGSEGLTGMQSAAFEDFMEELCDASGVKLRDCFKASFCLSVDVCNAFDPNFADVSEKQNNAKLGCGVGILKYTGVRGKGGASDAPAEVVAMVRGLFAEKGVAWQMAELGKVDQGGGGTVAKYMANRNIPTIDAGVPVLSMHAPYEIVSKLDCYMTYKGILAVFER